MQDFLEKISQKIDKSYTLRKLSDNTVIRVPVVKTKCIGLDCAFRTNGIPRGRIIELYGNESSGKTTLSLFIADSFIKAGGNVLYIDAEHSLDPRYMKSLGLDFDKIVLSQPDAGEEAVEVAQKAAEAATPEDKLLIVIDSVASLVPQKELDNPSVKESIGLQARLMSKFMRKIKGVANQNLVTIICINQIRMKIGVMWGNPETTPGGMALKFYCSIRAEVKKIQTIKKSGRAIGIRSRIKITKNKLGCPYYETQIEMRNGKGIDLPLNAFETLKNNKLLGGRSLEEVETLLASKPKTLKKLRARLVAI
jgi:recombination protein RecA